MRLLLLSAIAPLKVGPSVVTLFPIVKVPRADEARLIALETVNVPARKEAEPPAESPRVIATVDGPAAPETVVALPTPATNVPLLIVKPPVKVLAPERDKSEVELF